MKFHIDITADEYLRLHTYHMQHSREGARAASTWRLLGPLGAFIVLYILYMVKLVWPLYLTAGLLLIVAALAWRRFAPRLMLKFQQHNVRVLIKRGIKFYDANTDVEFGEEEILQTGGAEERRVKYADIMTIVDDGMILLIRYNGNQYMLLPKRCIGAQYGAVKGLLARKGKNIETTAK